MVVDHRPRPHHLGVCTDTIDDAVSDVANQLITLDIGRPRFRTDVRHDAMSRRDHAGGRR